LQEGLPDNDIINNLDEYVTKGSRIEYGSGQRYEVTNAGRYYRIRSGRGKNRVDHGGGKFEDLPLWRQKQYYVNKVNREEWRKTRQSSKG
jgi:hypothetical protein